jgi:hypothetical protein
VSRCVPGKPLRLRVTAPAGGSAAVDAGRRRHGRFTTRVKLDAGQQVRVAMRSGHGDTTTYHVRCLPRAFPDWTATRSGPTQAAHYLLTPDGTGGSRYPAIFDHNGVPVWWSVAPNATFDFNLQANDELTWARYHLGDQFGWRPGQAYEVHGLDGRRTGVVRTVGSPTDVHDLRRLPGGHYLAVTYRERHHFDLSPVGGPADATVLDGEVQELTPRGKLVWSWKALDHVAVEETAGQGPVSVVKLADGREVYDPIHLNSVEPNGDELILSMRSIAAVFGIDRDSGAVRWKLGGTKRPESLTLEGDERGGFGGQHDARLQPDGTLTLFDNATGRNLPPRAVRLRLDRAAGTATLVESISDPDVPQSNFAGSARRLPGGNWVVSWGGTPRIGEYTPAGKRVFSLVLPKDYFSYRAIPLPRGRLSTAALRRGMDAQFGR